MACVDLPEFPLQLLLQQHPDWIDQPVAVVDSDRPQGLVLYANDRARAMRILPGMRYAAGLSLAGALRAAVMPREEIARHVETIRQRLEHYTPNIEPATDEPGVFWLDASGLEPLFGSLQRWGGLVREELQRLGFRTTVVVGFSCFGSYAAAKAQCDVTVFRDSAEERAAALRVALERLAFPPAVRDTLAKLGIRTVGGFVNLPPEGIAKRFGAEVERLHRLATGRLAPPLNPSLAAPPALCRLALEHTESAVPRLMAIIEGLIDSLLTLLDGRGQALVGLEVGFRFERNGDHIETLRPASPTLDARQLLGLVQLRLEALKTLPDGVVEVVLMAQGVPATGHQLKLLAERPKRDLEAAERALARVRAELGDCAVRRASLRDAHLPEASFTWDAIERLSAAAPREADPGRLVRRIYTPAVPLPARPQHEIRSLGPYLISGGWWARAVHREYYFAETRSGELLWIYFDRPRRRWYLQGRVE